jgi:1-phosphofructokinase
VTRFLSVGYHNRVIETTRLDPAGRGVSVSRALHILGIPTHAIILLGYDATGRAYESLLVEEQFPITILRRDGRTRSNIVIKDTGQHNETVLLEDSEGVTASDLRAVADMLLQIVKQGDTVVFAGSLPNGVRADTYAWFTSLAQTIGVNVAINAGGGEALQQALQARPSLIYLTQTQIEGLFNYPVRAYEDVIHCAQQLREQGAGKVLVAMPRTDMALLVAEEGIWLVDLPGIGEGTRTGQAEAIIAGYLTGRLNQRPLDEALELGAAAAAYTASQMGNEFGALQDVEEHIDDVDVTPVEDVEDLPDRYANAPGDSPPKPPGE